MWSGLSTRPFNAPDAYLIALEAEFLRQAHGLPAAGLE
jgi:hypothetical protein